MSTSRPNYCTAGDVLSRIYADEDPNTLPANTARDNLLTDIISTISRRFDDETERNPGGYAPVYESRIFSARGAQLLTLDECASIIKVEINTTPTGIATWTDVSGDFALGQMTLKPIRFWPKREIFRMKTFFVDPYQNGNVRMTGIWGAVQPDIGVAPPLAQSPTWNGLSDGLIQSLAPNPAGPIYGWWIIAETVKKAVAEWTAYTYKAGQAAYGDVAGSTSSATLTYSKAIPASVQDVIEHFRSDDLKLAMIGTDGTDFADEAAYPMSNSGAPSYTLSRWSGWQTLP